MYDAMIDDRTFARCYCVNLERRRDRWDAFISGVPSDWPFPTIERFQAIDGKLCNHPSWWSAGGGAWGCYRSHLAIVEQCLNNAIDSVLILEDDAIFDDKFVDDVRGFITHLPDDWGMIYLGGQHLHAASHPPIKVNNWVYRPYNVNRTHAYALRGKMMRVVYDHLCRTDWQRSHHIDHHLGRLVQRREHPIYCPARWLVGQNEGRSNISGRTVKTRFWPAAESYDGVGELPFVAVVGLHSSGSSCLAGILYHLGVHMGNELGGYYGTDPETACGFEAVGLADICERAVPFPECRYAMKRPAIWRALRQWINQRRHEALLRDTIAGGKYPQLCRLGDQLTNICGDQLRAIVADRCIDESIRSLQRRTAGKICGRKIAEHQKWLQKGKIDLIRKLDPAHVLKVDYDWVLARPEKAVDRIVDFLKLEPTPQQLAKAIGWVKPKLRNIA